LSVDEPRRSPGDPGPHTEQHHAELLDRLGVRPIA
jgi:sulfonate transport system ATP-binding protein